MECIALPSEDRATATSSMYGKFGEVWTCISQTRKQTDKQTYMLIAIIGTPTGGKAKIV